MNEYDRYISFIPVDIVLLLLGNENTVGFCLVTKIPLDFFHNFVFKHRKMEIGDDNDMTDRNIKIIFIFLQTPAVLLEVI